MTMKTIVFLLFFKQCTSSPVSTIVGLHVTDMSLYRLPLKDTVNPNRIYYMVKPEGNFAYGLKYRLFFDAGNRGVRNTPVNEIKDIFLLDSTLHDVSKDVHCYKGEYIEGVWGTDKSKSIYHFDSYNKDFKDWKKRMRNKEYGSSVSFVFYVDKSATQPYEIRMRLDSCVVRSRVKKDTMRWMFR